MNAEPAIERRGGRELQDEVEELVEAARSSREYGWLDEMLEQRYDARHRHRGHAFAAAEDQGETGRS